MDKPRLRSLLQRRAIELDALLSSYEASAPDAVKLRRAIQPLLTQALAGGTTEPFTKALLPGEMLFTEGQLGKFPDLANAFAKFAIEISGGPNKALQELRASKGLDPLTGDPS